MAKVKKASAMITRELWNEMYDYVNTEITNHSQKNVKDGLSPLVLSGIRFHYGNPVDMLQMETHTLTWKNDGVDELQCPCMNE